MRDGLGLRGFAISSWMQTYRVKCKLFFKKTPNLNEIHVFFFVFFFVFYQGKVCPDERIFYPLTGYVK